MTVRFQAFHSIKAIGNREVLFNWSRTNPLGALDQVWRPTTRDELQQLLREYPERKLRLIGSGLSFEPIHSVYAEGSQALLVDLHHLRGQRVRRHAGKLQWQRRMRRLAQLRHCLRHR